MVTEIKIIVMLEVTVIVVGIIVRNLKNTRRLVNCYYVMSAEEVLIIMDVNAITQLEELEKKMSGETIVWPETRESNEKDFILRNACSYRRIAVALANPSTCKWTYDEKSDSHETTCNVKHYFINGGVSKIEYRYCPYCGGKIEEVGE